MELYLILLGMAVAVPLVAALMLVRYVPNDRIGVVEKRFSGKGSIKNGLIALNGEAGFAPTVLRGGFHWLNRIQYRLHIMPLVTITQGKIGYVFARDGAGLEPTQTLASNRSTSRFEDVEAFLRDGGQRGPQRTILREGTYAINLAQFAVITEERVYFLPLNREETAVFQEMATLLEIREGFSPIVIQGAEDRLGIVTVHDGPALADQQIIAPVVGATPTDGATYHNCFQDPEKFLAAGGRRGRQLQVLVEGTYYINRLFATIELVPKTVIDVGNVGVVVSYTGELGLDLSGKDYKHGELVRNGERGVWSEPLLPGKYAFNTYAGKIVHVPTTNFVLKWNREQSGPHRLDENLSEVSLITRDAFEPALPLAVVVHIDYLKAPLVVQRFGDIKRLVEQTLDPMVSSYFKNIAQTKTLIELLQERSDIQQHSGEEMRAKFANYSLELQEVLIGTPRAEPGNGAAIETILNQLRERQIAIEKVETYKLQETAAVQERTLREKQAMAEQQAQITASSLAIQVRENEGKAQLAQRRQEAETIQVTAKANAERLRLEGQGDADRIRLVGLADAEKIRAVGLAQAEATEKQVEAFGGPQYQLNSTVLLRFAEAIEAAKIPLVPSVMVGGGGAEGGRGTGGTMVEMLLAMLVADKAGARASPPAEPPPSR